MKQKIVILFIIIVSVTLSANAYDFIVDGLRYNINSNGTSVAVTKDDSGTYYANLTGNLHIPSSVSYNGRTYSVTSIDNWAFFGCRGLTSVTIGDSVATINDYAFSECSGLVSITIPKSVTKIGNWTFQDCTSLTSIEIPNSVTELGEGAFSNCSSMTSVSIPSSVSEIGNYSFSNCSGLVSASLPNSINSIGEGTFSDCKSLSSFTIPNSVTKIDNWAFLNCISLTSVNIPFSVTTIGLSAFFGCSGLTSVVISNSVETIDYNAFSRTQVKNITLTGNGPWILKNNMPLSSVSTLNIGSGISSLNALNISPTNVYCYNGTPPTCSSNTFTDYNGTLHIPTTAIAAYISSDFWQNFSNFKNDITQNITLDQSEVTLTRWETLQLTATIFSNNSDLTWYTSNPAVATVDNNGMVTVVGYGQCDIFSTLKSNAAVYASCHIISPYPDITLSLNEEYITIDKIGAQMTIVASITPDDTGLKPMWTSTNEGVAAVDDNGVVTAVSNGECDIMVTALDKTATCHVIVYQKPKIILDKYHITIEPNGIAMIVPSIESGVNASYSVVSSKPSVALAQVVNGKITVTAFGGIANDTTMITVSQTNNEATPAVCEVIVIADNGDINCDGVVNTGDVSKLYSIILGKESETTPQDLSDVNNDGAVNTGDVSALYSIIMGMPKFEWEYIYGIGNGTGWSRVCPLWSPNIDGIYDGFIYIDGEFKFRSHEDTWDAPDWGGGASAGTLKEGGNITDPVETGYYKIHVDLTTMRYELGTKITTIGVIGDGGNWDTDKPLTYNPATGAWEGEINLAGGEIKFRANNGWDINWGGDVNALTQGGANIAVEAGTYKIQLFAFCDNKAYVVLSRKR